MLLQELTDLLRPGEQNLEIVHPIADFLGVFLGTIRVFPLGAECTVTRGLTEGIHVLAEIREDDPSTVCPVRTARRRQKSEAVKHLA